MKMSNYILTCSISSAILLLVSCHKKVNDPCEDARWVQLNPIISELVGDSAFQTDTAFVGAIQFDVRGELEQVSWKIGPDEQEFDTRSFVLKFIDPLPAININLFARMKQNEQCFPGAGSMIVKEARKLTVLPRDQTAKSPLTGTYSGVCCRETPGHIFSQNPILE